MSVKSNYFKMNKEEFENYINTLKHSSSSIHLLNNKYFYYLSTETNNLIISLNKKIIELDSLINSFTLFSKRQIVQSFLIEEIEATNKIENINSTRHDIFKIINQASCSKDKKIISISNAYKQLLDFGGIRITSNKDIRSVYDKLLYGFSIVPSPLEALVPSKKYPFNLSGFAGVLGLSGFVGVLGLSGFVGVLGLLGISGVLGWTELSGSSKPGSSLSVEPGFEELPSIHEVKEIININAVVRKINFLYIIFRNPCFSFFYLWIQKLLLQ